MKKVICIGSATKDIFIVLGETTIKENLNSLIEKKVMSFEFGAKIYAEKLVEEIGGSAVNVATGLTLGGCRSFVFARTDKSKLGKWIQKKIGQLRLKKNYMQTRGSDTSAVSAIISDKKHLDHTVIRTGDSVECFDLGKALNKFKEKADWIYVGSLKKNSVKKLKQIIAFAELKKTKLAFVPSSYQIENDIKELSKFFRYFEIIFLNRDEAIEILKNLNIDFEDEPLNLLQGVKSLGFKVVTITDGAEGAYITNGEESYHLETTDVEKQETVGAGDAFASGFLSTYIEDNDIRKGLSWGIINSGAVLTEIGSTKRLLKKKELKKQSEKIIKKIKKI